MSLDEPIISIIIPCFNEEEVISLTWDKIQKVLLATSWDAELIFVDDGSSDGTLRLLKEFHKKNKNVRILSLTRNFGQQAAISAGLQYAKGDAAIIMDADLQDPPELIVSMVKSWKSGEGKIIIGKRVSRLKESFFKKLTAKLFNRLFNFISEIDLPLNTGDFRLVDRLVIDNYKKITERNKYNRGIFSWLGFKTILLDYQRVPRSAGVTKYSMKELFKLGTFGVLSFSKKPLKISLGIGIINIFISLALTLYALISYLSHKIIIMPGWTFTLIVIIFFSGFQFLILGILGSYIGMISDEVKGRPEYIIDEFIEN